MPQLVEQRDIGIAPTVVLELDFRDAVAV